MVEDIDFGRFFELATSNKMYVNSLNLHEIKKEILQDYTKDFELNGLMIIGPVEHRTNIRFKNMDDSEGYLNATDIDYDSEYPGPRNVFVIEFDVFTMKTKLVVRDGTIYYVRVGTLNTIMKSLVTKM